MNDDVSKLASRKHSKEEMRKAEIRRKIEAREEELRLYKELGLTPPCNRTDNSEGPQCK